MHNFGVPSVLKLWIDQIARVNKTFSYATGTPVGLLTGKKATILIASGGIYDAGTAMASYNFVEPYLRTVLRIPRRHRRNRHRRRWSSRHHLRQDRSRQLPRSARRIHPRPVPGSITHPESPSIASAWMGLTALSAIYTREGFVLNSIK